MSKRDWTHKHAVDRCDHCGRFERGGGGLLTLPNAVYHLLTSDNQYSICEKCSDETKFPDSYWIKWIAKQAKKAQS